MFLILYNLIHLNVIVLCKKGPLWEAVRGPGYCYGMSVNLSPEKSCIELNLDECSNLPKAYEATRKTFVSSTIVFY